MPENKYAAGAVFLPREKFIFYLIFTFLRKINIMK
jgi:hypothetical protein